LGFSYPKFDEEKRTNKLFVPRPICAAAPGEHCKMYSGFGRRNEPHAERQYQGIQAVEQDYFRSDSAFIAGGNRAIT
jgi:hypothetical protein